MIWIGNDAVDVTDKVADYVADLELKIVRLRATNTPLIIVDRRSDDHLNRVDDNEEGM
jgi:hypothetical protein